jgi:membrane glycosyltransferase
VLARWLHAQRIIRCDFGSQEQWLEQKREEREVEWEKNVSRGQWELVREVAIALRNKRIVDNGDKELLGL